MQIKMDTIDRESCGGSLRKRAFQDFSRSIPPGRRGLRERIRIPDPLKWPKGDFKLFEHILVMDEKNLRSTLELAGDDGERARVETLRASGQPTVWPSLAKIFLRKIELSTTSWLGLRRLVFLYIGLLGAG